MAIVTEKSSTGLDANLAGLLCYALGWISGLILFVLEKDSRFVKFHAMQSLVVFGAFTLVWYVLLSIPVINVAMVLLSPFVFIALVIVWILLMYKAYNGEKFKLPIAGDIAEQQANK